MVGVSEQAQAGGRRGRSVVSFGIGSITGRTYPKG